MFMFSLPTALRAARFHAFILAIATVLAMLPAASRAADLEREQKVVVGSVSLAVRDLGRHQGIPVVLVPGTGMQLVEWPEELIQGLLRRGRRVILFDNRDAGHSTHYTAAGLPDFAAMAKGGPTGIPYTADDLGNDVIGLLESLEIRKADLVGMSGGATQAELVALKEPELVHSLVLIAANSGNPAHPLPADPKRMAAAPLPRPGTPTELVASRIAVSQLLAGRASGGDPAVAKRRAELAVQRDTDPFAATRQGMAIFLLGDLRARQTRIAVPTTVIHGTDDPLIALASGEEVARTIPGARMVKIEGMGHELAPAGVAAVLQALDVGSSARH